MSGELWNGAFQIGKETVAGTGVAATRILYCDPDSKLTLARDPRMHKFQTQTRETVRQVTLGPQKAGGTLSQSLSASEILEFLLMTIQGNVSPSTPGGITPRLWTFKPSSTLDPATIEWHDGARAWEANGLYGTKLSISGSVNAETKVACELLGLQLVTSTLTGSLTARTPDFIEGWETKLYIDAFAGTPGTTNMAGLMLSWNIEIDNGLKHKYTADNTTAANKLVLDEIGITATLAFEAAPAAAATEFTNWGAATKRLVRLEFGQNEVIEATYRKFITVDLPGAWTAFDLGGSKDGTRTYELKLQYVYDPTNAFGLQIRCQNARTAAW